jgi:hypothetical protein
MVEKALASPVAMPVPREWGGGVMGVSVHDVRSDLHIIGFRVVEGTPAFGRVLPFAGQCANVGLGRFMRTKGVSSPSVEESMTNPQGVLGSFS